MTRKYSYDLEILKGNILINTETYGGSKLEPYIWDAKEGKLFPMPEYMKKKQIEERKRKIQKIKDKL